MKDAKCAQAFSICTVLYNIKQCLFKFLSSNLCVRNVRLYNYNKICRTKTFGGTTSCIRETGITLHTFHFAYANPQVCICFTYSSAIERFSCWVYRDKYFIKSERLKSISLKY